MNIDEILDKNITDLSFQDYACLFAAHLPGGTYEEVRVYVPYFFDYLVVHQEERLDLITGWVWWSSQYWDNIINDGAADYVTACHRFLLDHITKTFEIVHFNQAECQGKGWRLTYYDYVVGSETINEFLSDLWRFKVHRDIVYEFIASLADFDDQVERMGWFVEISSSRYAVPRPPTDERIEAILGNEDIIDRALSVALQRNLNGTYWNDCFARLGA